MASDDENPGSDDGQTHYDLGVAYLEMEQFEDALEELFIAEQVPELACRAGLHIGAVYLEQGHLGRAVAAWRRALTATGRTPELEKRLARLLAEHAGEDA
jgi:tetratricopeptide (TPR) repeat protein